VQRHAIPLDLETAAQRLLAAIDPGVSSVLIGEATHGAHELYRIRADLTRALIQYRGFTCVAAEADWPEAYRANLGDARATSLSQLGELNLGQLARERLGRLCCSIGMTTHDGDVTAAHEWDEPAALRSVRPSLPGSYECLFHESGLRSFVLRLSTPCAAGALSGPRLERAIGVLYRPETERASHYFTARLPEQFGLLVHVDRTRALEPLETWSHHEVDMPETYPTGV
jgi:erythromycin esterase-like protein